MTEHEHDWQPYTAQLLTNGKYLITFRCLLCPDGYKQVVDPNVDTIDETLDTMLGEKR